MVYRSYFKKLHGPSEGRLGFSGRKIQMKSDKKKERPKLKRKLNNAP